MKIVADENIPHLNTFFSEFGEITALPGRQLTAADVRDADALIVRSVTRVNKSLLAGSNVKFVGTCTIGTDHLDTGYLDAANIRYASAPGCNAGGVVQYVLAALATLKPAWRDARVGVVGHGNVGGRLCRALTGAGVDCIAYDPFLSKAEFPLLADWHAILECDVICMHTPYTDDGPFPTHHMMNEAALKQIRPGALLLNAGRGGAIDNEALLAHLRTGADLQVVLDVWEREPHISCALAQAVHVGTPHIAGYSFEGKINGAAMIYLALSEFAGGRSDAALNTCEQLLSRLKGPSQTLQSATLNDAILATYDIRADHKRFMQAMQQAGSSGLGVAFDHLRKTYPERRELDHFRLTLSTHDADSLKAFGFRTHSDQL